MTKKLHFGQIGQESALGSMFGKALDPLPKGRGEIPKNPGNPCLDLL
jgi:hypothetical protein